ncbi:MAG: hypothetical protein DRI90_27440 [Deltaproteobacteria bacterium]|nr:MAG: hypothetical protein DRI90_27440 [Deltaproteobacteria bacterium]
MDCPNGGNLGRPVSGSKERQPPVVRCALGLVGVSGGLSLPSFYEGLPLVLIEALACGCRLVSTALPAVAEQLAPQLGDALTLVSLPPLVTVDEPEPADLGAFTSALSSAIGHSLDAPALGDPALTLAAPLRRFTWPAVFERVEQLWQVGATRAGR